MYVVVTTGSSAVIKSFFQDQDLNFKTKTLKFFSRPRPSLVHKTKTKTASQDQDQE